MDLDTKEQLTIKTTIKIEVVFDNKIARFTQKETGQIDEQKKKAIQTP